MSVIFLFIDGVGLGKEEASNPFVKKDYPGFERMSGGQPFTERAGQITDRTHTFKKVDARLDVEGLPQSGTGQASLFSGENAAKEIGKHFGPYPHSGIKHLLKKQSVFHKAQQLNKQCQFINAYPDIFFKKAKKRNRWSCTTLMTKSADCRLNSAEEVKNEEALTAELTQKAWREHLHIDVPEISPETAADRLLSQAHNYDLILHEYYLTDKAGHSQEPRKAAGFIGIYNLFLDRLLDLKGQDTTIILCSDHGNVEDLSTKTHTLNKVPLFAQGPGAPHFHQATSIMDVTPGILEVLGVCRT